MACHHHHNVGDTDTAYDVITQGKSSRILVEHRSNGSDTQAD